MRDEAKIHFRLYRRPAQVFASDTPVGTRIRGRDVPWVGRVVKTG